MSEKAANKFEQEEGRVNGNHDLDSSALGPRHIEARGDRGRKNARLVLD